MTHNQHSRPQHTDAIYLGEVYLIRPADDHMSTAATGDPNPPKPGSLRELASGLREMCAPVPAWILGFVVLAVLMTVFN